MVLVVLFFPCLLDGLSVLALSSRFDGLWNKYKVEYAISPFSTRSVESF